MSDTPESAPKKKGKKKLILGIVALAAMVGGGVAAGVYAASSGMIGGGGGNHAEAPEYPDKPKLVRKGDEKAGDDESKDGAAKEEPAEGGGQGADGKPTPEGHGGEKYASNYYALDKDFTSNLRDSVHVVQVGVAVSTPYDEKVVDNLKANTIAVRSAVLMTLGDTTEDQVFSSEGKRQLQARLVKAINQTLEQKEGFGGVGNVYFTSFVVQ